MKVIGFDCWTVGARHYQRLVEAFAKKGLDLMLIHLGSWGDEKGRPAEEVIGDLPVRDISFYTGTSLRDILELEKPSAVIFTSTDAFAHRAFNRYCRERKVPTVHLFHGFQHLMEIPFKSNAFTRLWLLRHHIAKLLRFFLPVYVRSLLETKASREEWRRFARDIVGRMVGIRPKVAANDSKTDRACVYVDIDIECATKKYGHSERDVFAVGNPDLVSFGLTSAMIGSCARSTLNNEDVVYVDTALRDYGFVFDSTDEFIRHVIDTGEELSRQGKRLVFKPHPAHGPEIISAIATAGIDFCSNEDFLSQLQRSCACVTEPSTASVIPALIGLPLFLARYGKLRGQVFGELLGSYPRARYLTHLSGFTSLLAAECAEFDSEQTLKWIKQNTGPLPAREMPSRVADIVLSLINERRSTANFAAER